MSGRGLLEIEEPDVWARIGRGAVDVGEPIKAAWLALGNDPAAADAYRKERDEDARLYQRGLLGADPTPGQAAAPTPPDPWRAVGLGAAIAPALLPYLPALAALTAREQLMSLMLTSGAYDAATEGRRLVGK